MDCYGVDLSFYRGGLTLSGDQWRDLVSLWGVYGGYGVEVGYVYGRDRVEVVERIGGICVVWYTRGLGVRGYKHLGVDRYGVIGLGSYNFSDRRVLLTEGVSDYLSVRMMYPGLNVLGNLSLGGSESSRRLLLSISDEIYYFSDNDMGRGGNVGLGASLGMRDFYRGYGKEFQFGFSGVGYKDICSEMMDRLRRLKS